MNGYERCVFQASFTMHDVCVAACDLLCSLQKPSVFVAIINDVSDVLSTRSHHLRIPLRVVL
jgi:hypothetical protein